MFGQGIFVFSIRMWYHA